MQQPIDASRWEIVHYHKLLPCESLHITPSDFIRSASHQSVTASLSLHTPLSDANLEGYHKCTAKETYERSNRQSIPTNTASAKRKLCQNEIGKVSIAFFISIIRSFAKISARIYFLEGITLLPAISPF